MTSSGWNSTTKKYSFESTYPKASYNLDISPSVSMTTAQYNAFAAAGIVGSSTDNIVTALGTVPTVNIPVIIHYTKK